MSLDTLERRFGPHNGLVRRFVGYVRGRRRHTSETRVSEIARRLGVLEDDALNVLRLAESEGVGVLVDREGDKRFKWRIRLAVSLTG